jgi:hypothetical protein
MNLIHEGRKVEKGEKTGRLHFENCKRLFGHGCGDMKEKERARMVVHKPPMNIWINTTYL